PDLLHERTLFGSSNYAVEVAYGNGHGFEQGYAGSAWAVVIPNGLPLFHNASNDCSRRLPSYLKDLDGDGLLDFACTQLDSQSPCPARANGGASLYGIGFGHGGGFSVFSASFDTWPSTVSGRVLSIGNTAQVEVWAPQTLRVAQDYLDLDGDGIGDH